MLTFLYLTPVIDVNPIKAGDTTVGGTCEPDSTVTVVLPDGTQVTTTNPDGTWTVTVPTPIKEDDVITAVSTDGSGNTSKPSSETAPTTPVVDTTVPSVNVNPVKPGDTTVGGTSEPGSTVTVTLPDGTTVDTTTKPDGTWTVTTAPLKEGETVTAVSKNPVGNVSKPDSETVPTTPVVVDKTAPVITPIADQTVKEDTPITSVNVDFNAHDDIDSDGPVITVTLTEDNKTIDKGYYFGNTGGNTGGNIDDGAVAPINNSDNTRTDDLASLPDTGEANNGGLLAGTAALLGGLLLMGSRKRKEDEAEEK